MLKLLGATYEPIKVIGLPEGIQDTEAGLVDETARNAFPALERVGEGFAVAEGEVDVDVDVIGHDDVAPEVVALAVEVMQAVGDDLSEAWITQGAGAVSGVEVLVELVGELAVVVGFGDVVPRRRIGGQEGGESVSLLTFRTLAPFPHIEYPPSFYHETLNYTGRPWIKFRDFLLKLGKAKPHNRTFKISGSRQTSCLDSI